MTEEQKRSNTSKWFLGCAVGLVLMGILCAGGAFWAVGKGKELLAEGITEGVTELLENSKLPEEQIVSIEGDLERLRLGILEGDIALQNLGDIEGEIEDFAILGAVQFYDAFVIPNTDLTDEEKASGQRTMQRFARGVVEGSIEPGAAGNSFDLKTKSDAEDGDMFHPAEVRGHIAGVSSMVEEAGIPDEPYQMDLAVRFEVLVDSMLE